jgi:hypothetical protein
VTERELQEQVRLMCAQLALYHYHAHDSRRTQAGFPDCWIINLKTGRAIFRELKAQAGKLTAEQRMLGYALAAGGHDWAVWRPSDYADGTIGTQLAILAGHRVRRPA